MAICIPSGYSESAGSRLEPMELMQEQHSVGSVVPPKTRARVISSVKLVNLQEEDHRWSEDKAMWKSYCVDVGWENVRNFDNILCQFEPDFFQRSIPLRCCCRQRATYCGLSIYSSAIRQRLCGFVGHA